MFLVVLFAIVTVSDYAADKCKKQLDEGKIIIYDDSQQQ